MCEDFEIRNLGEHRDLCLRSDILLLADVFGNFRKMCIKICELHPAKFLAAPELARQVALKTTRVGLELLTDIDVTNG